MSWLRDIHDVLCEDNGLAALCTQNGWIDNDSIWFTVEARDDAGVEVSVHFDEVVTKGGGCVAKHEPCWGRVRVAWHASGHRVTPL